MSAYRSASPTITPVRAYETVLLSGMVPERWYCACVGHLWRPLSSGGRMYCRRCLSVGEVV